MIIKELYVYNFRNLKKQRIHIGKPYIFLHGKNGQGKTAFLEAVYLLSHAKSFRSSRIEEMLNWDASGSGDPELRQLLDKRQSGVSVSFDGASQESKSESVACAGDILQHDRLMSGFAVEGVIETLSGDKKLSLTYLDRKKIFAVNDSEVKTLAEMLGNLLVVSFTSNDLELITGAPQLRRNFCDRFIALANPLYTRSIYTYQKALKNRNKLISDAVSRGSTLPQQELRIWDQILASEGTSIYLARKEYIQELNYYTRLYYEGIVKNSVSTHETVGLVYKSQINREQADESPRDLEEKILLNYEHCLRRDVALKTTTYGVHRDDMQFMFTSQGSSREARQSASQGQLRSIALAIKLATSKLLFHRTYEHPVVLLDDVESDLDSDRRRALYKALEAISGQVIVTGTSRSTFFQSDPELRAFIEVDNGIAIVEGD